MKTLKYQHQWRLCGGGVKELSDADTDRYNALSAEVEQWRGLGVTSKAEAIEGERARFLRSRGII